MAAELVHSDVDAIVVRPGPDAGGQGRRIIPIVMAAATILRALRISGDL
jgi:hypothetical protein